MYSVRMWEIYFHVVNSSAGHLCPFVPNSAEIHLGPKASGLFLGIYMTPF